MRAERDWWQKWCGNCHFGPTLQSFILYQYYHALVTEPLLHEQLREYGVQILTGQLHRLITEGKERFHHEKDEILRVGLRVSGHVHTDDTGARWRPSQGQERLLHAHRQRVVRLV